MGRSIDVRGVIRRVLGIYVEQATVILPAAAIVFLIAGALATLLDKASGGLSLLSFLVSVVAAAVVTGMAVDLVADLEVGRRDASVGRLIRDVQPVLGQLILVAFVTAVAEGIGLVLLIVPGLILMTVWFVFAPVIVVERPPGLQSLRRSRELVRGSGWQVFGVLVVLVVVLDIVSGAIAFADRSSATIVVLVVRVIIDTIAIPISALASAVVYYDLKDATNSGPANTT